MTQTFDDVIQNLQPASFRGVPFGVSLGESRFGRDIALHEYPFKDKQWPEDLGRATRKFMIQGFLITDSLVYGGGDVLGQREKLVAAAEAKGSGTLIHPTYGRLQVSVPNDGLVVTERLDASSFMEFTLYCYEAGVREFPSASTDSADDSEASAEDVDTAMADDYADDVGGAIDFGSFVTNIAVQTAADWAAMLGSAAADATSIFNLAADLPGDFGRFFNGALAGYAQGLLPSGVALTLESLVLAGSQARTAIQAAGALLIQSADRDQPNGPPAAAQACVAALIAATPNPADGVRLLSQLANFYPAEPTGPSVIGQASATMQTAFGTMLRRACMAGLVRVAQSYQPKSEDDANATRQAICDLLDREALVAGDTGDDASYMALATARGTVANDLDVRGAQLPPMRTFTLAESLPSLVVAQTLYQDSTRADQLVDLANPPHPAFMPLTFKALSS